MPTQAMASPFFGQAPRRRLTRALGSREMLQTSKAQSQSPAVVALLVGILASGCTNIGLNDVDHGAFPDNYQSIVRDYYKAAFNYPKQIADAAMMPPQKIQLRYAIKGQKFVYLVCTRRVTISRYGGYTGLQLDAVLIKQGAVVGYADRGVLKGDQLCPTPN